MKTTYFNENQDFNLSVDYGKMMGSGWTRRLKDFLNTEDMQKAMFTATRMYKSKEILVFPKKNHIFKIFNKLDVQEINVAIINCNPRFNDRANGIAFANEQSDRGDYDVAMINLFDKISAYEKRRLFKDDFTLEHWINQYVFLYNVSLTGFAGTSQRVMWFGFTRAVLQTISKARQGVIFLFVGTEEQCRPYIAYIDANKHTILRHDTLSYDALKQVNEENDAINGEYNRIRW